MINTTSEFSKLTAKFFATRLARADLVTKTYFDNKLSDLNGKIVSNKTKDLVIEKELKKLKHSIRVVLKVKVILKRMECKIG